MKHILVLFELSYSACWKMTSFTEQKWSLHFPQLAHYHSHYHLGRVKFISNICRKDTVTLRESYPGDCNFEILALKLISILFFNFVNQEGGQKYNANAMTEKDKACGICAARFYWDTEFLSFKGEILTYLTSHCFELP